MDEKLRHLEERRQRTLVGGGTKRIEEQHKKNKLTARERLAKFLDADSFVELGTFSQTGLEDASSLDYPNPSEGVVTGYGTIAGRRIYIYAQDFTVAGGSLGEVHAAKICRVMDLAASTGSPIVGFNDSGGARIQEGVYALNGYGSIFYRNTLCSGVIPQISVIMGPCAGGAVYSPAITDFIFMVNKTSNMFITGPQVIKTVTGEDVTPEELGGAVTHNETSGVAHFFAEDEDDCFAQIRNLISFLPSNNVDDPPLAEPREPELDQEELATLVPDNPSRSYDVRAVIRRVIDGSVLTEVQKGYAQNAVIGFAHINGRPVGIIANQPRIKAGCLDINSSDKIARFVRFCDCFNLPMITFVDVPGFLPGVEQEWGGVIRHGAKLLYAYSEATVPQISVILRKAYGGAYLAMSSRSLGADICLAWPSAEIAVMGPEGAVNIVNRRELDEADDKDQKRKELAQQYREKYANPYIAAARGWVDDVIDPRQTRAYLVRGLSMIESKRKPRPMRKHGNIPL
ncbi:MAG TPA: acyl-CoA carboxylase subunit beta [Candidatus Limnocylindrales bacterium]|nr:acyl-CoA carboxylase subunit beta [Candidatus Limnocylindrales bacterium]